MIRYKKLGYLALNVTDLARSTVFYRDTLGLQLVENERSGAGEPVFFRCDWDHHNVMLFEGAKQGLKRIGFEMESAAELERLFQHLKTLKQNVWEVPAEESARFHQRRSIRLHEAHTGATFEFQLQSRRPAG